MPARNIKEEYFRWITRFIKDDCHPRILDYEDLLRRLFNTEFIYCVDFDSNRAVDGTDLRRKFIRSKGFPENYEQEFLDGPCSVLEMMVALAIRCERTIMDDPKIGDRTGQWFWTMINTLGLGAMSNDHFNLNRCDLVLDRFLNREYKRNGEGGLFKVSRCRDDFRKIDPPFGKGLQHAAKNPRLIFYREKH